VEADVDAIGRLAIELHEFTARGVPGRLRVPEAYDLPALRERVRSVIGDPDSVMLVAEAAGGLIGFVEASVGEDAGGPLTVPVRRGFVQSLLVSAAARHRGIGGRLMEAAEAWALERGATEVRLKVWEFEGGPLEFYRRRGYATVSRELVKPLPDALGGGTAR
jgi:GNAT superfamily N-acetyltransferase